MGPVALSACATPGAVKPELAELQAEVRALRAENAKLEGKLEQLQRQRAVATVSAGPAVESKPENPHAMPELTVVKLKPKREAAPKLGTHVDVVEPEPEVISSLAQVLPAETSPYEGDAERGEAMFNKGMAALKTGDVEGGIAQLQQFVSDDPKHTKADNALYFSGVGYMGLNDYEDAVGVFEAVVKKYPAGDAVVDALLKLAECRVKLNQAAVARKVYQRIVNEWPDSTAAQTAKSRLSLLPNPNVSP